MDALLFAVLAVGVTVGAFTFYVGNGVLRAQQNASRRLLGLQSRAELLEAGFNERALAPLVEKLGRFALRFTPQGWVDRAHRKLLIAGWGESIDGNTWAAIRIISLVVGVLAGLFLQGIADTALMRLVLFGFLAFVGFFGPEAVLNRKIDERRSEIERQLPDVIDLLVISVEAGLGFESAMGRVVQNVPGELAREFARALQETRVGVSRHEALRNMAARTDVEDLNSFILALNQADQFGVSIARMLRVQAEEMRVRRRQRAQERAFAAPVKMVFPLVFFIFPAIFVVIIGPAVINISQVFSR
ncbi:MAG TPA: type II secretion system F family protein [Actinobacteria bacterium]|nr:type II secretion system F family protein [Actinomycetota bacterium]